jgi:predicted nucleic acid-binding protein
MESKRLLVVVSDAGPLIHLSQIGKLCLLEKLFQNILVTVKVKVEAFDEGVRLGCADAKAIGEPLSEGWLVVELVPERLAKTAAKLSEGENVSLSDAETLLLAKEKDAELLVDEKVLSDLAKMYGLKVWSTWTVLLESLSRGLIEVSDVENAIDELGKKRYKLKEKQAAQILDAAKQVSAMRTKKKTAKS